MISKLSILRPVSTVMVVLMVFLGGFVAKNNLEIAFMPSIEYPVMMVGVSYDNAGPQEVMNYVDMRSVKTQRQTGAFRTVLDVYRRLSDCRVVRGKQRFLRLILSVPVYAVPRAGFYDAGCVDRKQ